MACAGKRVVAWIDKSEFEQVYNEIFSSDNRLQHHALERLSAWKCRMADEKDLPHFIVSTSELLSVKVQDEDSKSELIRQLTYAMALVRFVNLLTEDLERAETRDRFYSSFNANHRQYTLEDKRKTLKIIAKMLGIPEWQVDLRHAATHYKKLPSLTQLLQAVDFALVYLKENWWKTLLSGKQADDGSESLSDVESAACQSLQDFMQTRFLEITSEMGKRKRRKSFSSTNLSQLEVLTKSHSECILSVLVDDGYMIFSTDQLVGLGLSPEDLINNGSSLDLPDVLVVFWQPVLYLLNNLQLTSCLLEHLASKLGETSNLQDRIIAGWISTILSAVMNYGKTSETEFSYLRQCSVIGRQLLQKVLHAPNRFTEILVNKIFPCCVPHIPEESIQQILELVHCYVAPSSSLSESMDHDWQALHAAEELMSQENHVVISTKDTHLPQSFGCWTLATNESGWSLWPIGSYRGQNANHWSLELPSSVNIVECHPASGVRYSTSPEHFTPNADDNCDLEDYSADSCLVNDHSQSDSCIRLLQTLW